MGRISPLPLNLDPSPLPVHPFICLPTSHLILTITLTREIRTRTRITVDPHLGLIIREDTSLIPIGLRSDLSKFHLSFPLDWTRVNLHAIIRIRGSYPLSGHNLTLGSSGIILFLTSLYNRSTHPYHRLKINSYSIRIVRNTLEDLYSALSLGTNPTLILPVEEEEKTDHLLHRVCLHVTTSPSLPPRVSAN